MNHYVSTRHCRGQSHTRPLCLLRYCRRGWGVDPEDIVKLDANENPYGPSPKAVEALQNGRFFHIYPDPESNALRDALSDYVGVPKGRLMAGAGADELIDVVLRVVLAPGDVVIDCPPSFGMYPFSTAVNAGQYVPVWRNADFSLDVAGIEPAVTAHSAKVLFLCAPNNPDGSLIDDATLRRLLLLPVLVVLDEAYVDFAEYDGTRQPPALGFLAYTTIWSFCAPLASWPGWPGCAWAMAHSPNGCCRTCGKSSSPTTSTSPLHWPPLPRCEDRDWLHEKVRLIVAERERMVAQNWHSFDWLQPYPSRANFVLFRVLGRDARQLKLDLEQHGILVRYFNKPGLDNCIRISVGRPQDTAKLITALAKQNR